MTAVLLLLAACSAGPRGIAADWADRFPQQVEEWELAGTRLELTAENQSNNGHVTLTYENDDETQVHISIDVYATPTAAQVVLGERMRGWQLQGARFERIRPAGYDAVMLPGGYLAYLLERETIFTLAVIPPQADSDSGAVVAPEETIEDFQKLISAVISNR